MGEINRANPYAGRLIKAKEQCERALRRSEAYDRNAMPGTYVTGNSGVPASRRRRLDQQIERTIDLAKKVNWHKRNVAKWQAKYDRWEWQRENPSPPAPAKPKRPLNERQWMNREITRLLFELDCEGHIAVAGATVRCLVGWSEEVRDFIGVIEVHSQEGAISWRRAKSIQGVHLHDETARAVIEELLIGKETS